jgi:diacylglycerol kinase family enzyme
VARRILLLVNPISGRGRALRAAERFLRALRSEGAVAEEFRTATAGDATRHAAEARGGGFDAVVAVGGDGTVNEALNGLEGSGIPVGILPAGTANVLARDLGLPFDPEGAARVAARGRPRALDTGEARSTAGTRRFLCCAGAGFDGAVVRAVAEARSAGGLGFRGWIGPIRSTLSSYDFPVLRLATDGGPPADGTVAVVCNTANYGGLFRLVPGADPGDGALDTFLAGPRGRGAFFRYLWGAWRGTLPGRRGVVTARGVRARIDADRPVPVQVDGDAFGETPLEVALRPASALVLVP